MTARARTAWFHTHTLDRSLGRSGPPRMMGSEDSSSVRTGAKMAGQGVAPAELLQTERTLKVGVLVTRKNVALEVVPTVEARVTIRVLALILLWRGLWEVEVVWVRWRGRGARLERMSGVHVGTWCDGPLQGVL